MVAILVVASLLSPWVRHEWSLSLGRQPTPYTQLGFSNAVALPPAADRGEHIHVAFVITNDEGNQLSYHYVVASGSGAKLASLTSGTKTVAAGASWAVDTVVTPQCAASTCRVQVSLPAQNERIDFQFTYLSTSVKKSTSGKKSK